MHPIQVPAPTSAAGAFAHAFEQLDIRAADDSGAYAEMSPDQHIVLALGILRREVSDGGFAQYFREDGGNTALDAQAAAVLIGRPWQVLVTEACRRVGSPYPTEQAKRAGVVDALLARDPDLFTDVNSIYSDLEDDEPVEDLLDEYVWAQRATFF
jgi:hypothetical protein